MEMVGEIFNGNNNPDSFRSALPRITPTLRLFIALNPTFAEAIKLTPEQVQTITTARDAYLKASQAAAPPGPGGGPGGAGGLTPEMIAARTAAVENLQQTINSVLTLQQTKRLPQLIIQSDAAASLVNTLTSPEIAKGLELTPEQTAKLIAVGEDAVKLQELRTRELQNDPEQKLGLRLRDLADERMLSVLTDAQKAKWKELTGEPWLGLRKTIPTRFGGPGGGRPGGGGLGGGGFSPFDP
jgi:hypothetical protein